MTTTDLALDATSSSSSPLARLEIARRLLANVRSVDDVKAIHDFAEARAAAARDWVVRERACLQPEMGLQSSIEEGK